MYDPLPYLEAMAAMASSGGMIPEQVWDSEPIPRRWLYPGCATGSAMPLAWAHAEFIKLLESRHRGRPFDRPQAVWARYGGRKSPAERAFWWPHAPIARMTTGIRLVVALTESAVIHWGHDGWIDVQDIQTVDTELGFYAAKLDTTRLPPDTRVDFTWRSASRWHGRDYGVRVVGAATNAARTT